MATAPFQTVGGLASMILGQVPEVGDSFTWEDHDFRILSVDGLRVDRIRVGRKMDEAEDSAQISSRE